MLKIDKKDFQNYQIDMQEVFDILIGCIDADIIDNKINFERLKDPYSQEVQLILYLYSIEPAIYA